MKKRINKDVTTMVDFGSPDDECLPIFKCICGKVFEEWSEVISIYEDDPWACPECMREYFFTSTVKVFQVVEESKE